jgi:hypothetical protein
MTGARLIPAQFAAEGVLPGDDTPVPVPSGQDVRLIEVVWGAPGPEGLTYRFRFLAPAIAPGGGVDFDTAVIDMEVLCRDYALPRIAAIGPVPTQIVVSLSDRPVPFGEADPTATQFFEAYSIEGGTCIWEPF